MCSVKSAALTENSNSLPLPQGIMGGTGQSMSHRRVLIILPLTFSHTLSLTLIFEPTMCVFTETRTAALGAVTGATDCQSSRRRNTQRDEKENSLRVLLKKTLMRALMVPLVPNGFLPWSVVEVMEGSSCSEKEVINRNAAT